MSQSMSQDTFTPTQMVNVALQAQEWNVVFAGLSELPYRLSQPVIEKLRAQFNIPPSQRPNGGLRDNDDEDVQVYRRAREA